MFNPLSVLTPITEVVKLFRPDPKLGGSPPVVGVWRPVTALVLLALIVVSFFTGYVISEELWIVTGLFLTAYGGGRTWEKTVPMIIKVLKD